jgi:H+/Cl- antiporter ClcA
VLRSGRYLVLLVVAAATGAPVAAAAYGFLALVSQLQTWLFHDLPGELGFAGAPAWWPLPLLAIGGLLTAAVIRYLPGGGGPSPAEGFHLHGAPGPAQLPGVVLAALATLSFGAVLGPEAPLIALGGGLCVLALRLSRRPVPARLSAMLAAAGSFSAISTLLGSPVLGAFLLMEASGLSGMSMELVLLPGLLAAGVGALVAIGLNAWSGLGTFSLAIPQLPHFARPDIIDFCWALVIGLAAALLGAVVRRLALLLRPHVERRLLVAVPAAGLAVAGLAILYAQVTGKSSSQVLFSGQTALAPLVSHGAGYPLGTVLLLLACKSLGYGLSLSSFRGGPVFPSLFTGAAGGLAMSHLPGLALVPAVAMGMGAMCAVMLTLPLTAVLLATLLLFSDGIAVTPLVIVAVVVAYAAAARLTPKAPADQAPAGQAAAGQQAATGQSGPAGHRESE